MLNIEALNEATKDVDLTKPQAGATIEPPAAGPGTCVLIGYIEVGKHEKKMKGVPKLEDTAIFLFELTSPKHAPREHDGVKYPHILKLELKRSMNEKANYFKLFQRMNYEGKASHFVQLLGKGFKCEVFHRKYTIGQKEFIAAELSSKEKGISIAPPRIEVLDEESGDIVVKTMKVNPAISHLRALLWDKPSMDQWASIFIEGEYAEEKNEDGTVKRAARSKNVYQIKAASAKNYEGSALHAMLSGNGVSLDIPDPGQGFDEDDDASEDEAPAAQAQQASAEDTLGDIKT